MLGLMIKDIRLIKNQGIAVLCFLCLIGILVIKEPGALVNYASMLGIMYAFNTISYDNYENGCSFLFTLPVSRKLYAAEKYMLTILFSLGACLVSGVAVEIIRGNISNSLNNYVSYLIGWAVLLWVPIVMLPIKLKWGAEKSRLIMILLLGICMAMWNMNISSTEKAAENVAGWINMLNKAVGVGGMLALAVLITAAAFTLSMGISMRIMEKKEF